MKEALAEVVKLFYCDNFVFYPCAIIIEFHFRVISWIVKIFVLSVPVSQEICPPYNLSPPGQIS